MNSKIYRCGYCGNPTDPDGNELEDEEWYGRVCNIIDTYGDSHTVKTNGFCCAYENGPVMAQVTREMALDAGDPSLEGQWIPWG